MLSAGHSNADADGQPVLKSVKLYSADLFKKLLRYFAWYKNGKAAPYGNMQNEAVYIYD